MSQWLRDMREAVRPMSFNDQIDRSQATIKPFWLLQIAWLTRALSHFRKASSLRNAWCFREVVA